MSSRDIDENGFDESTGKTSNTEVCPECEGVLVTEGGEVICTECGLIVEEYRIDHGDETPFSDDERTGAPVTPSRHDRGLSTVIGIGTDAQGNSLSGRKRRQLNRLRREHSRAQFGTKKERNLAAGCTEIARMTTALGLPRSVRDRASTLFRRAHTADLLRGRSIEAMAAASVYGACRCGGHLRTLQDIVAVARCERSRLRNAYSVLNAELCLPVKPRRPSEFLPRLASDVDVPDHVRLRARELVELAEEAGIGVGDGCNPAGVAAGALYLAAQEEGWPLTQTEIAAVTNLTPVTLRARYQELQELK